MVNLSDESRVSRCQSQRLGPRVILVTSDLLQDKLNRVVEPVIIGACVVMVTGDLHAVRTPDRGSETGPQGQTQRLREHLLCRPLSLQLRLRPSGLALWM